MKRFLAAFALACLSPALSAQSADNYPNRPIRMIVPWTAGSATDAVARHVAERLRERWNNPVIVENRSGASGIIGSEAVAKAAPDGYTLLVGVTSHLTNPFFYGSKLPYDTDKDFSPIILMSKTPAILWYNPQLPVKNLKDLIALAKKDPGKLVYASSGTGNTPHLTAELFKQSAGVDIGHAPYKGAAASVPDVLGGHVPLSISLMGTFQNHYKSGRVKALAVASPTRMSSAPEIPTFAEEGFPQVLGDEWFGLLAPSGTPPAILEKINKEVAAIIQEPATKERLEGLGMDPMGGSIKEFVDFMDAAKKRWDQVIKAGNIQMP